MADETRLNPHVEIISNGQGAATGQRQRSPPLAAVAPAVALTCLHHLQPTMHKQKASTASSIRTDSNPQNRIMVRMATSTLPAPATTGWAMSLISVYTSILSKRLFAIEIQPVSLPMFGWFRQHHPRFSSFHSSLYFLVHIWVRRFHGNP